MAQFYGEMQGSKGPASRMGSKQSGLQAHIRGWTVGVAVECQHVGGEDVIDVYFTGGSGAPSRRKLIARIHGDGRVEMFE
jgi:hypothetical protein